MKAFTCLKESNDCSGSERKLSALLHHHFDHCLFPSSCFFPFFLSVLFPPGNMWVYCVVAYVKCTCHIHNRADVSAGAAVLLNKTPLTCQPAPWLCVRVPPLAFPKTKLKCAASGEDWTAPLNRVSKAGPGLSPFLPHSPPVLTQRSWPSIMFTKPLS